MTSKLESKPKSTMAWVNEGKVFHEDRFELVLEEMEANDWEEVDLNKCRSFLSMDLKPGYPIRYISINDNDEIFYRSGGFVSLIEEDYIVYKVQNVGGLRSLSFSLQYTNLQRFFVLRKLFAQDKKIEKARPVKKQTRLRVSEDLEDPEESLAKSDRISRKAITFKIPKAYKNSFPENPNHYSILNGTLIAVHKTKYYKDRFEKTQKFQDAKNGAKYIVVAI
jgi:hypothetical protein